MGIPKDSILRYETAIKTGKFVVIAHGSADESAMAREIISRRSPMLNRPSWKPDHSESGYTPYHPPAFGLLLRHD